MIRLFSIINRYKKLIFIYVISLKYLNKTLVSFRKFGSDYGGWNVPIDGSINEKSIVVSIGIGEDISFDIELIDKIKCTVFALDPTPRAKIYVDSYPNLPIKFHFRPYGIWNATEKIKFYPPRNPKHVSYSAVNLQGTSTYETWHVKSPVDMILDLGVTHIDYLKMDIEGAEIHVIPAIISDGLSIKYIAFEIDSNSVIKCYKVLKILIISGYILCNVDNQNLIFIRANFKKP